MNTGPISLTKGGTSTVSLQKTGETIKFTALWQHQDYDLITLVHMKDGSNLYIGSVEANGVNTARAGFGIKHSGDVRGDYTSSLKSESLTIDPDTGSYGVKYIVPVIYSAQKNGLGSFNRYRVSAKAENGSQVIEIPEDTTSKNETVFSYAPVMFIVDGTDITMERIDRYSLPGSENRPTIRGLFWFFGPKRLWMSFGPKNQFKY